MKFVLRIAITTGITFAATALMACSSPAVPTAVPTEVPEPPAVVATATDVPPTTRPATSTAVANPPAVSTATSVPPTITPSPSPSPQPIATTVPPTVTPVPPTSTPEPVGQEFSVDILRFTFENLAVQVGDTVTWINQDAVGHTTTSGTPPNQTTGAWASGTLNRGDSFSFTFDTVGRHPYFCEIHPGMTATITVTEGG